MGLIDYRQISNYYSAPSILPNTITASPEEHRAFTVYNAVSAPTVQMHLFVLFFDAPQSKAEIAEKPCAYWYGGNKNEFVVCLGRNDDESEWAHLFSWADEPTLEVQTADWLHAHPSSSLTEFLAWFMEHYSIWKRKSFSDFDYINVSIPTKSLLFVYLAAAVGTVIPFYGLLG